MTKERAIATAHWYLDKHKNLPTSPYYRIPPYFYRIGPSWMTTTRPLSEVQSLYKRTISDYQSALQLIS